MCSTIAPCSHNTYLYCIYRYLCDHYDPEHRLLPPISDKLRRSQVQRWVHAAEGTYALHGLPILYTRWFGANVPDAAKEIEQGMSVNVQKDLDFLEKELAKSHGQFLVGDSLTIADIVMLFSVQFIFARKLGTEGKKWEKVSAWVERCEATDSYQKAVKKTGHKL